MWKGGTVIPHIIHAMSQLPCCSWRGNATIITTASHVIFRPELYALCVVDVWWHARGLSHIHVDIRIDTQTDTRAASTSASWL